MSEPSPHCLSLLNIEESDARELYDLVNRNRGRLKKFWWEATTLSPLDSRRFIVQSRHEEAKVAPEYITRGIFVRAAELIGVASIHSINWEEKRAALGYWIDEAEDGNGYATEAVRSLSKIAFTRLMLNEITISPRESNVASRHVAERNRFELERIDREPEWQLAEDEDAPLVAHYVLSAEQFANE